ncbi:hypothetical protein [uncultured Gimesia sp.]|jgi:hypothetical protein|uniref:hypothetical protein n=1 Tax=uncultured Gimesia sp. TaxID=1678688 RepID=UPI00261DD045|nr:hypothetical protein [uncultured Gimesia sp.]
MNLVEYQTALEHMIETQNFDQRSKLENLAARSPEHQTVWEDFLIVEYTLPAWQQDLPEVDLVEAVMSQLSESPDGSLEQARPWDDASTQTAQPRSSARWFYAGVLAVAALLVTVSLKIGFDRSELTPSQTISVNTSEIPISPAPPAEKVATNNRFNQLLRNAGAASWGLASSTAGAMTEAVSLVPVTRQLPETADTMPAESNWVDDINHEMQPLKEQISHAWNFILHSVPEESTRI